METVNSSRSLALPVSSKFQSAPLNDTRLTPAPPTPPQGLPLPLVHRSNALRILVGLTPRHLLPAPLLDRLLLATDGSPAATAAAQVAGVLAAEHGAPPDVLTVLPAFENAATEGDRIAVRETATRRFPRLLEIQRTLTESVPESRHWTVELQFGAPAPMIVTEATRRHSTMILLGLRPHGTPDHMLLGETAYRVVHDTATPVLAVTTALRGRPRRVAVAVDFSRASIAAAEAACTLVAPGGTLYLVHTGPGGGALSGTLRKVAQVQSAPVSAWKNGALHPEHRHEEIMLALTRLQRLLKVPASVRTIPIRLPASAGDGAFGEFGRRADIELLALGRQPWPLLERLVAAHVVEPLIRAADCSVLLMPPVAHTFTH